MPKKSRGFLFVGKHVSITYSKHICCGKNVKFESFSEIQGLASEGLIFGDNVMIGPKCSLFAENHNFSSKKLTIKEQGVNQKEIVIEDDCWIGSNVIILDGVKIGRGSVIGAGSLVSKDIPAGSIYINKRNINIRQR
ncbi:hypothetical protein GPX23_08725 [Streptococcus thermophilus]|nr:hypothetical protein [Streptococcus thermophilus]MCE2195055.1 hypothetical protein [Streptococcus thermophilus]MCE2203214.1 hypothetical protein [Streptococcus thermophilus]MCE2209450.1 hypothetical protein [Streptococcus thermophilus]MCE2268946.1 hypothetical protein [Streptococcus thermophilus]